MRRFPAFAPGCRSSARLTGLESTRRLRPPSINYSANALCPCFVRNDAQRGDAARNPAEFLDSSISPAKYAGRLSSCRNRIDSIPRRRQAFRVLVIEFRCFPGAYLWLHRPADMNTCGPTPLLRVQCAGPSRDPCGRHTTRLTDSIGVSSSRSRPQVGATSGRRRAKLQTHRQGECCRTDLLDTLDYHCHILPIRALRSGVGQAGRHRVRVTGPYVFLDHASSKQLYLIPSRGRSSAGRIASIKRPASIKAR